jgi:hypothetical protein
LSNVVIRGWGAVSPAGWSTAAMRDAMAKGERLPSQALDRPGQGTPLRVLRVPAPQVSQPFRMHPRLRRTSSISQFAVAAAAEATGTRPVKKEGLGVIVCVFSGCVNYSRRFYDETLKDPRTASPLLFPETVFNAPASHISAYFGSTAINYTLVGDSGTFLVGLALAAQWLTEGKVEECLVVGAEEIDWMTADALRLFDRSSCLSEGAGALLLSTNCEEAHIELRCITDEYLYTAHTKTQALERMREELGNDSGILFDSTCGKSRMYQEETRLWRDWSGPRFSAGRVFGEGLMAGAAWQSVLAADALQHGLASEALISIAGFHQHAIGARLVLRR